MKNLPFDLQHVIDELKAAARNDSAGVEVNSILRNALQFPDRVEERMSEFTDNDTILFEDETVSIWHCRFDPGYTVPAHDHQMMAFIGIYRGAEKNILYSRQLNGQLAIEKEVTLLQGDVLQISPSEIHAVSCASEVPCCGIHVYLGCLTTVDRSLFDVRNGDELKFTDDNYHRLTRPDQERL